MANCIFYLHGGVEDLGTSRGGCFKDVWKTFAWKFCCGGSFWVKISGVVNCLVEHVHNPPVQKNIYANLTDI